MFEVRPYVSEASIKLQFDGTSMRDGYPAALTISQGSVFITNEPFTGADGNLVTLNAAEAGALALTSSGMSNSEICDHLGLWFDCGSQPLGSLYGKLGGRGIRPESAIVAAAFEKGVYVPDETPCLTPIRKSYRQRFFDLTAGLSEGAGLAEIGAPLNLKFGAMSLAEHEIAKDLGLGHLKRPGAALVFVAGAANMLPLQTDHRPKDISALFPEGPTQRLLYNPTEDPTILFRFAGQPLDRTEVDVRTGYVDWLTLGGAIIRVCNKQFTNHENVPTELQPIEMTALLLKCVLKTGEVELLVGHNGGNSGHGPLLRAYDKLLPLPEGGGRKAALVSCIRELFKQGMLAGEQGPDISHLPEHMRNRFYPLTQGLADGKSNAEVTGVIGASASSIHTLTWELRSRMKLSTAGLVLASEAQRSLQNSRSRLPERRITAL